MMQTNYLNVHFIPFRKQFLPTLILLNKKDIWRTGQINDSRHKNVTHGPSSMKLIFLSH